MKVIIALLLITTIFASTALGQDNQVKHRSGPRRQLATIVFAGLGGAILGLSTLSFYGRPQDQLSNIAIGFAVGVIAGTVVVTFKSATSRDYYDDRPNNPQQGRLSPPGLLKNEEESRWYWGPMLTKLQTPTNAGVTAYGGQVQLQF